jgi:hypothetical protein
MWDEDPGYKLVRGDPMMSDAMASSYGVWPLAHEMRVRFTE